MAKESNLATHLISHYFLFNNLGLSLQTGNCFCSSLQASLQRLILKHCNRVIKILHLKILPVFSTT